MKNLSLFFGFALLGVVFFACQKDAVQEQFDLDPSELLSVERSPCGHDPFDCQTSCISIGMCCCTIEWFYIGTTVVEPIPTVCVAKDVCEHPPECIVDCPINEQKWPGNLYSFCPSGSTTYLCVSKNTAISITNPNHLDDLEVTLTCAGGANTYTVPPLTTISIGLGDCDSRLGC